MNPELGPEMGAKIPNGSRWSNDYNHNHIEMKGIYMILLLEWSLQHSKLFDYS